MNLPYLCENSVAIKASHASVNKYAKNAFTAKTDRLELVKNVSRFFFITCTICDLFPQYFYNSQSGSFLYWDGEQQTYCPAPTDVQVKPPTTELQPDAATDAMKPPQVDEKKDKDKKEKVKVAKRIAKVRDRVDSLITEKYL